jgi:hypothetical protein
MLSSINTTISPHMLSNNDQASELKLEPVRAYNNQNRAQQVLVSGEELRRNTLVVLSHR